MFTTKASLSLGGFLQHSEVSPLLANPPPSDALFMAGAEEKPECPTVSSLATEETTESTVSLVGLLQKGGLQVNTGNAPFPFFWQPRFFEVSDGHISYWREESRDLVSPRGVFPLACVDKVTLLDKEITIHFTVAQRTGRRRRKRSYLCLRAASKEEAERWHEVILKAVAKLRTDLPPSWNVEQMLNRDIRSSQLVAKIPLPPDSRFVVQKLLDHTFSCKSTRDRHGRDAPLRLEVVDVIGIQNANAWAEYQKTRAEIRSTDSLSPDVLTNTFPDASLKDLLGDLDDHSQERFLFHGSTPGAIDCITDGHFNINLAGTHRGTMYGKGIYYAESSSKADEYAEENPDGLCQMLLCRVALGRIMYDRSIKPSTDISDRCKDGYDSLCADRLAAVGTFREFVIYDKKKSYPAYIISYRRAWRHDLSRAVRDVASGGGDDECHQLIQHTSVLAATYPEEKVRLAMAVLLDVHAPFVVPALVSCLDDSRDFVQTAARTALRQFSQRTGAASLVQLGESAALTVAKLASCLVNPHADAKVAAARALGQLGSDAAPAVPSLAAALEDADESVRAAVAVALGLLRINAETIMPVLTKMVQEDPNERVRKDAAWAYGRFGAAFLDDAMNACFDDSSGLAKRGLIGGPGAPSVQALCARMQDPDVIVSKEAIVALGNLGAIAKPAIPEIKLRLDDPIKELREAAAVTLRQIERACQAAVPSNSGDCGDTPEHAQVYCAKCTCPLARLQGSEQSSWHKDLSGVPFHIGHFGAADGVQVTGRASSEASWFEGWKWRLAACSNCGVHVGWRFESPGADPFWALIWDRLKSADSLGLRRTDREPRSSKKETRSASKGSCGSGEMRTGSMEARGSKESRRWSKESSCNESNILGCDYSYQLDDVVEAKYRLDGRWYPATIFKDFGDGSYEVYWHDGDTDDRRKRKADLRLKRAANHA